MAKTFQELMQEEQKAILRKLYSDLAEQTYAPSPFLIDSTPRPKPTLLQRLSWRWWRVRIWLANKLAGFDVEER